MANKLPLKGTYKPYSGIDKTPFETDAEYYKRLAKVADQRLVRLEKLSEQEGYKNVKQWAYSNAMYDLSQLFGPGVNRFNVKLPETKQGDVDLRSYYARINAVKRFIEAPTSTKENIVKVYKLRAETINEKNPGVNLTWEDMAAAFESKLFEKAEQIFGSKTAIRVIAKIAKLDNEKKNGKVIDKAKAIENIKRVGSEASATMTKEKFMAQYGLTVDDLFK